MNLSGWHTVATINESAANAQLAANLADVLQDFSYAGTDPISGMPYKITGTFGPWKVVPGGSGVYVHMALPLVTGTLAGAGAAHDLAGASVVVNVLLTLLPAKAGDNTSELRFAFAEPATSTATAAADLVTGVSCTVPSDKVIEPTVQDAVVGCLLANGGGVTYVFARIGLLGPGTPSWLVPTHSAFAYQQPIGAGEGSLAIFSMTAGVNEPPPLPPGWPYAWLPYRPPAPSLTTLVPTGLISLTQPLSFAMASDLFMQFILLPIMPNVFANTTAANFTSIAGCGIILVSSFNTASVKYGLLYYHPSISALTTTLSANQLTTVVSGSCGLKLTNASVSFTLTFVNGINYDAGTNSLTFSTEPAPAPVTSQDVPWYDYLEGGLGIGAAIIAIIIKTMFPAITNSVVANLSSAANGIVFTRTAPVPVAWGGLGTFAVKNAEVSDAFFIQGSGS